MMFNNKNGIVYHMGLVLTVFIILISSFLILQNKVEKFDGVLGEEQIQLIKQYQQVEDSLLLLDNSAKFKLSNSIKELADNGGFNEILQCGRLTNPNIMLWTKEAEVKSKFVECYPFDEIEDLSKTLIENLKKKEDPWSLSNLISLKPQFEDENPKIIIKNNLLEFLYIAKEKSEINLMSKNLEGGGNKLLGNYSFYPSFRISFPYTFEEYKLAKELVQKIIKNCADKKDVFECVFGQEINGQKFLGKDCKQPEASSSNQRFYYVCLKSKYTTFHGQPDIKFAFYLPDLKKPDLDLTDVLTGNLLNIGSILDQVGGNQLYISILDQFQENPTFDTYSTLSSGEVFAIPNFDSNKVYNFGIKVFAKDGNEYVYTIASKGNTVVINDGSVSGLSFEEMQ